MGLLSRHRSRIAVTLIPLVFALLHAGGVMRIGVLQRLDKDTGMPKSTFTNPAANV